MPCCVAIGCSNSSSKAFPMKYFPRDPTRRKIWASQVKRENWTPTSSSCLCEIHFEHDMWEKDRVDGRRKLKHNAIPTLFAFTKISAKRKPPKQRSLQKKICLSPVKLACVTNEANGPTSTSEIVNMPNTETDTSSITSGSGSEMREEISTEHWSREVTQLLIQLYEQHDFLYNTHSSFYHDKYKRLNALHSITVEISKLRPNTTVEQVKSKMANLRKQFSTELMRLTSPKTNASSAKDVQPVLWCFEQLQFLNEFVINPRQETFNPVPLDEEDFELEGLDTVKEEPPSYSPSSELPMSQLASDPSTSAFSFVDASDPKIIYTEPFPEPYPDNLLETHFSKFVCSSLGSIRSSSLRRLAIKRINDILYEIQEMDDAV